eukprot:Skav220412  [mRNA]  locus=scaffold639:478865:479017:- [translate_table: standard]
MPVPSFNVINGGSHAGNRLACQEIVKIQPIELLRVFCIKLAGIHDPASGS